MTIETDQLVLRPWRESDAAELFELARDPEVGPAAGWEPHASERESLEAIRGALSAPEAYAVVDRRTEELLGSVALKGASELARGGREFELGFWIGRPFWGYGYATEAAQALVRRAIGELGATRVWGACPAGDDRARSALEACGLVPMRAKAGGREGGPVAAGTGAGVREGEHIAAGASAGEREVFVREIRRTLFVDADACPVTREALDCAREAGMPVVIAGNSTQNLERHVRKGDPRDEAHARRGFWVDVLAVSVGADSADFAIVERLSPGDVVVTQDIGLAGMALGRDARAIGVRGHVYRQETIDAELLVRHEEKRVRRAGGRTGGPSAFTARDRRRFAQAIRRMLAGEA